jgi:DNA-binding NarL/FixJ family response regulator
MSQHVTDVMVVEAHAVFRRGLVSCLEGFEGIGRVEAVPSIAEAWSHPALSSADILLLDAMLDGARDFVASIVPLTQTRVIALAAKDHLERLAMLVDAGAVAALVREDLTPERLDASLRAVAAGATTTVASDRGHLPTAVAAAAKVPELTAREQRVLALVADGLPTREIGQELHYSERTVKKVLGDVVVKLGARSRSQAIARAVRQGII